MNRGKAISVRGSVVDVWLDDPLPPIYIVLCARPKSIPTRNKRLTGVGIPQNGEFRLVYL